MTVNGYRSVKIICDCETYTLVYLPDITHGRPQRLKLDASTDEDAKYEASSVLKCDPKALDALEIEYL